MSAPFQNGNAGVPVTPSTPQPMGSESVITPAYVQTLAAEAQTALMSTDRDTRSAAEDNLKFLSCFDNWDGVTKQLLPHCSDNALRFIVCKAIHFMVANELGPQERAEMKAYVLGYAQDRRVSGEVLPTYIQRELYLIYATALFGNWKIAIISEINNHHGGGGALDPETGEPIPTAFDLAAQMVEEVVQCLTQEEALDCLREVVCYFFEHISKIAIPSLRKAFVTTVLPYFFETAAQALHQSPQRAVELCCAVLETLGPLTSDGALITVRYTTESTIHILRWADGWSAALAIVMEYCSGYICTSPTSPLARLVGRLVQLCSRIDSPHEEFMRHGRDALARNLLQVSTSVLAVCRQDSESIQELLPLACEIFINTFERHQDAAIEYIVGNFPGVIQSWADAAQYVLSRFVEEEDSLRQLLMHLFYLFADRLLPRRGRRYNTSDGNHHQMMLETAVYGRVPPPSTSTASSSVHAYDSDAEGLLGRDNGRELGNLVERVFAVYFDAVIDKAHLCEDSDELRFEAGVALHNERTLVPLAEMLHCDKMNFLPMMVARLRASIEDFQVCAGARESALRSAGSSAPTPETTQRLVQILSTINPAQTHSFIGGANLQNPGDAATQQIFQDFHRSPLSMFLMRVCLSRLSVLISIFAIAIKNNTHPTNDEVLVVVSEFARALLTQDDRLTTEMLQTLNLFDADMDDGGGGGMVWTSGSGSGGGNSAGFGTSNNNQSSNPSQASSGLHVGILRSLFFFCNCVYDSNFDRRPELIDIMLDLLRFVYMYHSTEATLVVDANVLFHRVVTEGPTTVHLLSSDRLTALVQAVRDDAIPALRLPPPPSPHPPLPIAARSGFFTAFTAFVETRYYAGYDVGDVVTAIFARALAPERLQHHTSTTLEDVTAVTIGIQQPDTLLVALNAAMASRGMLIDGAMRGSRELAALVVRWLSVLTVRAKSLLQENPTSTTQWDLSSLIINAVTTYLSLLSTGETGAAEFGGPGQGAPSSSSAHRHTRRLFAFPDDAVDAEVVYDLADILLTLCTASWCNLGVVAYYERPTVERFFCGVVQLLTCVWGPLVMSSERGMRTVFEALITALTAEGQVFESLHLLLMRQGVWETVVDWLARCLHYRYVPEVVQALVLIIRNDHNHRRRMPDYAGIGERQLTAAFHEVAVLVAIAPFLELRHLSFAFDMMRLCFDMARDGCTEKMKALLAFCSAYHRVRLRTIWGMLVNNEPDMLDRYVSVFGQSSKVGALSAW